MKTEKKYELTDETIEIDGHVLHRIRAVRDFTLNDGTEIKKGDLGGFLEKEDNLSHEGNCWVYDNAKVFSDACVYGNAQVFNNAWVAGDAHVHMRARIFEDAHVTGDASVCDSASVHGKAYIYGSAAIQNNAHVSGDVTVCDIARIYDNAWVSGYANIFGDVRICGRAVVDGCVRAFDSVRICGYAHLCGQLDMIGATVICGDAYIRSMDDYCTIQGIGSKHRPTTFFNTSKEDGKYEVSVKCGCFNGTLAEFEDRVKMTHGDNKYAKEYLLAIELAKAHFDIA